MLAPNPYDHQPYTDHAYAESHPDRLSVVARLAGWEPPGLEHARILELGCGRGGNLLPMAASLPHASLVGVDRSARQIEEAVQIARAARVENVRFVVSSIERFQPDGAFDFVICHGVCSWVSREARAALLAKIATSLAPGGIAYVSFNVLPGWYDRLAARDWLRLFPAPEPAVSLAWSRDAISPERPDYRRRLDAVVKRLTETDPAYARHEYLADEHHPQLVSELLSEAAGAGLAYLGDAIPSSCALELLPEAVAARAAVLDVAARQQLVDLVQCTAFRRALLVRAVDAQTRTFVSPSYLDAGALDAVRLTSRLRPHGAQDDGAPSERFDGPDGVSLLQTGPGIRRALHALARVAPRSLALPELAAASANSEDHLRAEIFDLWLACDAVDLHVREPPLRTEPAGDRPALACALARWHATHGGTITNLRHQEVRLDDPLLRDVLARLDGSRSIADLARELGASGPTAALDADARLQLARAAVEALAAAALLVA